MVKIIQKPFKLNKLFRLVKKRKYHVWKLDTIFSWLGLQVSNVVVFWS